MRKTMRWHEPKRARNLKPEPEGHGLDFADARDRFEWATSRVSSSYDGKRGDKRFMAIGRLDGTLVTLIFGVDPDGTILAISLRRASNRERKAYAAQI
ncbi:BrnT family toxin [Methylobacterium sp. A54F]